MYICRPRVRFHVTFDGAFLLLHGFAAQSLCNSKTCQKFNKKLMNSKHAVFATLSNEGQAEPVYLSRPKRPCVTIFFSRLQRMMSCCPLLYRLIGSLHNDSSRPDRNPCAQHDHLCRTSAGADTRCMRRRFQLKRTFGAYLVQNGGQKMEAVPKLKHKVSQKIL